MNQGGDTREAVAAALAHHRAGRLDEAERLYRQVLTLDPRQSDTLHLLGLIGHQTGRDELGLTMIRQAIELNPGQAVYHSNLGSVLRRQGRLEEAVASYRSALRLCPDEPGMLSALGLALQELGRQDEALAELRRAVRLRPDDPALHATLAGALKQADLLEEALASYRAALDLTPDDPKVMNNLGATLKELGRLDEAMACYRRALDLKPDYPVALNNLATALQELGRLDEAAAAYRQALGFRPDDPVMRNNLGLALQELGRLDEAVASYQEALALRPDDAVARNNLGAAQKEQGRLDEAVATYRAALASQPDYPVALSNLGTALHEQRRLHEAVASYRQALALQPDNPDAHFNLATALLAQGDMVAGWQEYEWRWKTKQMQRSYRALPQPQWRGEPAAGRSLLVHAEQGYGDCLQFCRYATLAAAAGLRVIVQVPRPLVRLCGSLAGIAAVAEAGAELPPFDLHCPMMSLPLALGTTLSTVPGVVPYLHADPAQVVAWRRRLAAVASRGPRIGLVWAGSPRDNMPAAAAIDRRRSMRAEWLAPLLEVPGPHFFSLQKDSAKAPEGFGLIDLMSGMGDFADTAALISNLDLVITVDTAVAHLVAALGKPVWIMDRFDSCWRWLEGRRDSPWYPTLRLYRQAEPGAWGPVVAEVARDLRLSYGGDASPGG